MPRFFAVKQFKTGGEPIRVHKVSLPLYTEPGFYRSTGSLNAFFHGSKDRNNFFALHPKTAKANGITPRKATHTYWYHGERWEEFEEASSRMLFSRDKDLPVTEHASIWDFYKHIGYDYKTGKWLKTKGM